MHELFKILKEVKVPETSKIFKVKIEGRDAEVNLDLHKEILLHGHEAFMWENNKIVRCPPKVAKREYKNLDKTTWGRMFHYNDPYFPKSVPTYKSMVSTMINNVDFDQLKQYAYKLQEDKTNRSRKSNYSGWQSNLMTSTVPDCDAYNQLIKQLDKEVKKICDKENLPELQVHGIWTNISPKGGYNIEHEHPESIISGVVYISAMEDQGDIVFHEERYKPKTGLAHFFPADKRHKVEKNTTDRDRISIAFNYVLVEKGYSWQ